MDRKVIDKLRTIGALIGRVVLSDLPPHPSNGSKSDFHGVNWKDDIRWEYDGKKVWLKPNRWCSIEFYNVRPRRVHSVDVEPAQKLNEQASDVNSVTITNDSSNPVERTYTAENNFSSTKKTSMQHEVGIRMKATFGVSGTDANYGATALAEVETHYTFTHGEEDEKTSGGSRTNEVAITAAPHARTTVSTIRSTAKYRQKMTFDTEMDFSIRLWSDGDFDARFDSLDDLYDWLEGISKTYPHHYTNQYFRKNPRAFKLPTYLLRTKLPVEISFDNAVTGDIIVKEDPL